MAHAIVIQVPEAEGTCFIATPFDPRFNTLSRLIIQAANAVDLRSIRTDQIQGQARFTDDILQRIRAAQIVVAVCTPDPQTRQPNPNVLYELGLAQAQGKATLILTSDLASLPSDLKTDYVLVYDPGEIEGAGAESLVQRLRSELLLRKTRMTNPLTDPFWADVTVASARHRMLLEPLFWDDFRLILRFAKQVHDHMQTIDTGHVDALFRSIYEVVFGPASKRQKIGIFCEKWRDYTTYYSNFTQPNLFDSLQDVLAETDSSFGRLQRDADEGARKGVTTARRFYDRMKELLLSYPPTHSALAATAGPGLATVLESQSASKQVYAQVQALSNASKPCVVQADRLIVNLIDMMI
jgi:hypothetical protein